jgi:hypothetical protein
MDINQTICIACGASLPLPVISKVGQLCSTCRSQGLFRKQIIITGITRMNSGHICVSGVDPQTWRFVRPVFETGLERDFLMQGTTQVVNHFNLVEIEFRQYSPSQIYHTEDWIINENYAPRFIRHLTNQEIIDLLNRMSVSNLLAELKSQDRSLFIVKAQQIIKIWDEISFDKFKVRITFMDQSGIIYQGFPVTDLLTLAFVKYQKSRGNSNYAAEIMDTFNHNAFRYIRIGITREFQGYYYKQVTALITIPDLFNGKSFSYYEDQIGGQA